jgi:hypothetical protein
MSVSSPVMPRHEVQSSTATTRLPDSSAVLDDDRSQQSICEGGKPSTSSPIGHSYKADYLVMAAVFAIVVFLWMH